MGQTPHFFVNGVGLPATLLSCSVVLRSSLFPIVLRLVVGLSLRAFEGRNVSCGLCGWCSVSMVDEDPKSLHVLFRLSPSSLLCTSGSTSGHVIGPISEKSPFFFYVFRLLFLLMVWFQTS